MKGETNKGILLVEGREGGWNGTTKIEKMRLTGNDCSDKDSERTLLLCLAELCLDPDPPLRVV